MRIIAGKNRGTKLKAPAGNHTRPTSDRARESLFNILAHNYSEDMLNADVLDVFAGSGALGLEALSRGAKSLTFVENNRAAIEAIKANIKACHAEDITHIFTENALQLSRLMSPAHLIFMDPPYHQNLASTALQVLRKNSAIADGALVVLELGPGDALEIESYFQLLDQRTWGKARVYFLRFSAAQRDVQCPIV